MNIVSLSILMDAFFITLLVWCSYTDIKTRIVSNVSFILILCLGLAHILLILLTDNAWWPYPAGLLLCVPFLLAWLKNGMGAGDVKLMMGIGLYLGLLNTLVSFTLMIPVLILCMLHSRRKNGTVRNAIPFAPVLAFGAGGAVILGYVFAFINL